MEGILIGTLLGGLGLFLLGMLLMTNGLKQATGPLLGRVLGSSTQTRWRGLLSGMLITTVVQSSGAVTVAAIGFVNAGLLNLQQSLWVLFGANIGTTVTALLAAIGATPNARRAASAHVAFNVLAASVALVLLPFLVHAVDALRSLLGLDASPAISLAMFHTVFNLLGVALMWPLADRLSTFLKWRFRSGDEDVAQAHYLDRNVASAPSLAADRVAPGAGASGRSGHVQRMGAPRPMAGRRAQGATCGGLPGP